MFPPDPVVRAGARWLSILKTSHLAHGWALLQADSAYADLTATQYASGLEWLRKLSLVIETQSGPALTTEFLKLPNEHARLYLFERAVADASPAWLPDADLLIPDPSEIPADAVEIALALGVPGNLAFRTIRQLHGKIDLAMRDAIGNSGELELAAFLESHWPGSTNHVALLNDGFGYDLSFRHMGVEWHLEVKSTTRRGRLTIHLTRHEHEVGLTDPHWRLVVVGLDDNLRLCAVATARATEIMLRAPTDTSHLARWASARHDLDADDLDPGLNVCQEFLPKLTRLLHDRPSRPGAFTWMPV